MNETILQLWKDHPHATPQVRALARGFADRELPVATLLSDPPHPDDDQDEGQERQDQDERQERENKREDRDDKPQDVAEQHGRQLLDYLSRTRSVRGPGRDLLFMQSAGSAVGLDGQLAERLEEDAANGSVDSLCVTVGALNDDGRDAAVTLLIGQSLGAVGLEARNVALSLLAVIALPNVDVPARADELADALASPVNDAPDLVEEGGLYGAWELGLHSHRPTGLRLRELVLQYALAHEDKQDIAMMVLGDSDAATTADEDTTAKILVAHLLAEAGDAAARTAELLLGMPSDQATRLLNAAGDAVASDLRERLAPPEVPALPAVPATAAAVRPPSTAPPAASPLGSNAEPGLPDVVEDALGSLLNQLDGSAEGPAQTVVRALLKANRRATRELVEGRLGRLTPTNDPALASLLLTSCSRRTLDSWPAWLSAVSPVAADAIETDDATQRLLDQLWTSGTEPDARPATVQAAASAAVALLDHRTTEGRPSMASAVERSLGDPVEDDDRAVERQRLLAAAEPLLLAGALAPGVLATKEIGDLAATLTAERTVIQDDDPVVDYVIATALDALGGFSRPGVPGAPTDSEAQATLVRALHDNTWLPEPHATRLRLLARTQAAEPDESLPELPPPDAIRGLHAEHGPQVDDAVAAWLTLARPDAETLLAAADSALSDGTPSQQLLDAVAARLADYPLTDRVAVLHGLLDDPDRPAPSEVVLRAAGTAGARLVPDIEVARILAARNRGASNSVRRRHLMQAWANASIESDNARKLLFETVLIPLFGSKDNPAPDAAVNLGVEYLPLLAKTQPSKTKAPLGEAVRQAVGDKDAGKVLRPLGYKVSESGNPLWRRTKIDTSD